MPSRTDDRFYDKSRGHSTGSAYSRAKSSTSYDDYACGHEQPVGAGYQASGFQQRQAYDPAYSASAVGSRVVRSSAASEAYKGLQGYAPGMPHPNYFHDGSSRRAQRSGFVNQAQCASSQADAYPYQQRDFDDASTVVPSDSISQVSAVQSSHSKRSHSLKPSHSSKRSNCHSRSRSVAAEPEDGAAYPNELQWRAATGYGPGLGPSYSKANKNYLMILEPDYPYTEGSLSSKRSSTC